MKHFITLLLFSLLAISINAQSIADQMGAIKTDFNITSLNENLGITDQCLISRPESHLGKEVDISSAFDVIDYSYFTSNYESYHLDFISNKPIRRSDLFLTKIIYDKYPIKEGVQLTFLDKEGNTILRCFLANDRLKLTRDWLSNEDVPYYYSVDLIDVPELVLDKTSCIDIITFAVGKSNR